MAAADSIAGALQKYGRPMTLRRKGAGPGGSDFDVTVYGRSRNYRPEELVDGVMDGDVEITFATPDIIAAGWPAPPAVNDQMIIDGRLRTVQGEPEPKYLGTAILVYVCRVRG